MNIRKTYLLTGYLIVTGLAGACLLSCSNNPVEKMVIVTRVPADIFHDGDKLPAWPGASLVAINPENGKNETTVLSAGFYSACSPHVSYDATHILFSGQKGKNDPWQIWEMDLQNKTSRQVTVLKESCYTPFYLPGNRLVFSREMPDTGTGSFLALFTMDLDGNNLQQITFHPNNDLISTILKDGRILMLSEQAYPGKGAAKYIVIRPNGTKTELFYKGTKGTTPGLNANETDEGMIWFTEQNNENPGKRDVITIRYNRPLHSRINHTATIPGVFYSVLPSGSDELLVCYRGPEDRQIGLCTFSVRDKKIEKTLLAGKKYHYLNPVRVHPCQRPRNLPNELIYTYPTGLLMSQNINITGPVSEKGTAIMKATYIEVLGMDKSLGVVPVEQDGSFYLKIPADLPFRIQTLDERKQVILGPSDWLWVRPFERRGCVGCHEDPELAPRNIVPMAINTWPVVIPVDTTKAPKKAETFKVSNMK